MKKASKKSSSATRHREPSRAQDTPITPPMFRAIDWEKVPRASRLCPAPSTACTISTTRVG